MPRASAPQDNQRICAGSFPLQQLPLHILSEILQYAVNADDVHPLHRLDIVRVSAALYVAAVPSLYRSVRVSSGLHSLFLHSDHPLPADFETISSADLVRNGYTKLAALRYTRTLRIDIPEAYIAVDDEDMQMTDDQKLQHQRDLIDASNKELDATEAYLRDLPVGMMPSLESLQIGSMGRIFDHTPATRAADLAALLLYRASPRVWCQYHGRVTPLAFPIFQLPDSRGEARLPVLYRHTRLNYPFSIVPGSTTYLYIHRRPPPPRGGRPLCWRYREDPEATGRWIGLEIRETFLLMKDCLDQRTLELINATRIIIGGAVAETFTMPGLSGEVLQEARTKELRAAEEVAAFARAALNGGSQKHLKEVRIEVRTADEIPPCEVCGEPL